MKAMTALAASQQLSKGEENIINGEIIQRKRIEISWLRKSGGHAAKSSIGGEAISM